jgi:hypothetical protein
MIYKRIFNKKNINMLLYMMNETTIITVKEVKSELLTE